MSPPVIYEIIAVVEKDLVKAYEKYMRERHIPDLLATGCFRDANFLRSSENRYCIRYEAFSQKMLDNYLGNEAERLRADFLAHFPKGVELSREIWEVLQVFNNDELKR
jgi:hypothetical protein